MNFNKNTKLYKPLHCLFSALAGVIKRLTTWDEFMRKDIYELMKQLRTTTNPVTRWSLRQIIIDRMIINDIPEAL